MEIRTMAVDALTPAPYNPRKQLKHDDPAGQKLETSLREFGLVEPLVWNETTGHIVGGHARLAILRKLSTIEVEVSVVRLTPAREKALNIVLNNREAQGRFDPRKLTELLSQLDGQSEFDLTGFDQADFRAMDLQPIESLAPAEEPNAMLICLTVPREKYDELSPKVELLVREFDLECHVKEL